MDIYILKLNKKDRILHKGWIEKKNSFLHIKSDEESQR